MKDCPVGSVVVFVVLFLNDAKKEKKRNPFFVLLPLLRPRKFFCPLIFCRHFPFKLREWLHCVGKKSCIQKSREWLSELKKESVQEQLLLRCPFPTLSCPLFSIRQTVLKISQDKEYLDTVKKNSVSLGQKTLPKKTIYNQRERMFFTCKIEKVSWAQIFFLSFNGHVYMLNFLAVITLAVSLCRLWYIEKKVKSVTSYNNRRWTQLVARFSS